jgi:hypothetical protein
MWVAELERTMDLVIDLGAVWVKGLGIHFDWARESGLEKALVKVTALVRGLETATGTELCRSSR